MSITLGPSVPSYIGKSMVLPSTFKLALRFEAGAADFFSVAAIISPKELSWFNERQRLWQALVNKSLKFLIVSLVFLVQGMCDKRLRQ
jgi:hypothetical protein